MADLLKNVSDNCPLVTLVIVGVGQNISELIGEHPSIARNLIHIELATMDTADIRAIVETGFAALGLTANDELVDEVPPLANGFPHYAHLLGLCSAKACARNDTTDLTPALFTVACNLAVEDAIEKYRDAFAIATTTTQPSRYPRILCACSYAIHDDRGVFRATDVVDAMRTVFKEDVTVQAVVPGLGEFALPVRGEILTTVPVRKRNCYRFTDPMMRPFLRIKAQNLL